MLLWLYEKIDHYIKIMSNLLKQLKTIITPLTKHIESIEEHNKILCTALQDLLNEEDVKLIPSYELLVNTYSTCLEYSSVSMTSNEKSDQFQGYDPIHAPPKLRKKGKAKVFNKPQVKNAINANNINNVNNVNNVSNVKIAKKQTPYKSNYSSNMPDFDQCMIENTSIPKLEKIKTVKTVKTIDINLSGACVYIIDIKEFFYYLHNGFLYDIDTHLRIGSIQSDGFHIKDDIIPFTTAPVTLHDDPISNDYPEHFTNVDDQIIYTKDNNNVLRAVGTCIDGANQIW